VLLVPPLVLAASGKEIEQRLELAERRLDQITTLTLEVQSLREEQRRLLGRIEELQFQLQAVERRQRDLAVDVDDRLSSLATQSTPATDTPPTAPTEAAATDQPAAVVTAEPVPVVVVSPGDPAKEDATYRAAHELLDPSRRQYAEAAAAFADFLAKYPDSKLADNAQYWLAEAHYVLQDNAKALEEFRTLVERYPGSAKVPGAMLKIGYILDAGGQKAEAREILGQVQNQYPYSPAAGMAKSRLEQMDRR